MDKKKCTKCGEVKPLSEFKNRKGSKDGKRADCRMCLGSKRKEYYENNRERILLDVKEYTEANKALVMERKKTHHAKNRDRLNAVSKAYYCKDKEAALKKAKLYRENNKDKIIAMSRNYYDKNKVTIAEKNRTYRIMKMATDPAYRLKALIRRRISLIIDSKGASKSKRTEALLGATWKTAMDHLNGQGYNMDMHIDHIVPLANFNVLDEAHQRVMFHYLNLQPLTAFDNISKGAKLPATWRDTIRTICDETGADPQPIIDYIAA